MSSIEAALYSILSTDPAITAIVSDRIYYNRRPDSPVNPSLSYFLVISMPMESLSGPVDLSSPTFQFDCWSTVSQLEAKTLARKVRAALHGFRGVVSGVDINGITDWSEQDMYEQDTKTFRTFAQCDVWHGET